MTSQARYLRIGLRLLSGVWLALAGLGVSGAQPPSVIAAPQAGGTFTVTSTADDNTSDPTLSLREALLVARGGTGLTGLARPASAGEQAALAGCNFTAGLITGGCGPGVANSIVFTGSLGLHPIITLTIALPSVTNTATTTIDGSVNGVFPIVSASGLLTGTDALLISSDNNALSGLTITGAPHDDLQISGNGNQVLTGTVLLAASRYGLLVDGGMTNTITSVLVGTNSPVVGACTQGNQQGGVLFTNSALSNIFKLATVACNSGFGVRFDGSGTTNNHVIASTVAAQIGVGVEFLNGAYFDFVTSSTVINNSQDGILISEATTEGNSIDGVAAGNAGYGVRVSSGAHNNSVGGTISGNGLGGVRLETGAWSNNVYGIIGRNSAGTAALAALPNGGPGVDVDNAPNSGIGYPGFITIDGNLGPGVRFTNTTGGNVGTDSTIDGNLGPGVELISTTNTSVLSVVVAGNAGAGVAVEGNFSTGNLIAPGAVGANGGLPIDLGNDGHTPNGSHNPPGPNNWLPYPVLTAASGSVITGTACLNCTVLIYAATGNPAAPGSGGFQIQSATADGSGHWSATLFVRNSGDVTLQACAAPCNYQSGLPSHSDTSEFSPRIQTWLPVMKR